jgi:hypothetical protein
MSYREPCPFLEHSTNPENQVNNLLVGKTRRDISGLYSQVRILLRREAVTLLS